MGVGIGGAFGAGLGDVARKTLGSSGANPSVLSVDEIVCPACKTHLPKGAKFCFGCGAKIEEEGSICPDCGTKLVKGARFCLNCGRKLVATCSSCGAEVTNGVRFCMACGAKIQGANI
jgi:predicted amidophosphoribosyltransferase